MKGLTFEQLEFLKKHKVSLKHVFDAQGYQTREYKITMKDLDKYVAYNVTPCRRSGHTLRTRGGHCCQCNTAHLAFQKRNEAQGLIYVAGSISAGFVKIGYTKSVEIRSKSLNRTNYAGFNDWEILFAIECNKAGKVEVKTKSLLKNYSRSDDYNHDGHWQEASETFGCSLTKARNTIIEACNRLELNYDIVKNRDDSKYEFKNLKRLI